MKQQIIPYFISSHPGCKEEDMAELAVLTKDLDFHLEQVQDFTPTPMTISTETWYTGYDPYTLEPVFSAKTPREKLAQRQFFFWYKPEERRNIEQELRRIGRDDLIKKLYPSGPARTDKFHSDKERSNRKSAHGRNSKYEDRPVGSTYDNPGVGSYDKTSKSKGYKGKNKKSYNPNFSNNNHRK